MKIIDLNDDCLFEVFDCLNLTEKCGVQRVSRRWQRITDDMISVQDSLELVMSDYAFHGNMSGVLLRHDDLPSNAYFSSALNDLFKTGVIGGEMKSFLSKFDFKIVPNTDSGIFVDNIKHLTIIKKDSFGNQRINEALLQMLTVFRNLKSLKLVNVDVGGVDWRHLAVFAENLQSFSCRCFLGNPYGIDFAKGKIESA